MTYPITARRVRATNMKKVPCSCETCDQRRAHYETPEVMRQRVMVDVPDDYNGPAFCSIECAAYSGMLDKLPGFRKKVANDAETGRQP